MMLHSVSPEMNRIQLKYIEGIINCLRVKKISTKCTHQKRTILVSTLFM